MLPRVILFNETSLDGRMDWFTGDMGLYYSLAARWQPDAMLSGSDTMLAAYTSIEELTEGEEAAPPELHPLHVPFLVIVDSRGQIRKWRRIKSEPYWRNAIALCSRSTPKEHGGAAPRSIFVAPDLSSPEGVIPLRLVHVETVQENVVWLRYEVVK